MPENRPAEEISLKTCVVRAIRAGLPIVTASALALSLLVALPQGSATAAGHAPVRMPLLVGRERPGVYAVMRSVGLYFVTRGPGSANASWTFVTAQSVKPGTLVPWHSQVALKVTNGAYQGPQIVPSVVGHNRAQVYAQMRAHHLFFVTQGPGGTDGRWNRVVAQRPAAGMRVPYQSTVWLTVTIVHPRPPATTTTVRRPPSTTTTTSSTTTTTTAPGETTTTTPGETTTTTTTRPATTTTVHRRPKKWVVGQATWYSYIPGQCATWYLPAGHRLWIMDLRTHKVITCLVTDREAGHGLHVVDLSMTDFAKFAPLPVGVVPVRIWWR